MQTALSKARILHAPSLRDAAKIGPAELLQGLPQFDAELIRNYADILQSVCHLTNARWWFDLNTGEPLDRNHGEMLMLIVTELGEAMQGHRKDAMDDKLPTRKMFEVELADAVIRIFDTAGGLGIDLGAVIAEKLAYNAVRKDHTLAARRAKGGKKL